MFRLERQRLQQVFLRDTHSFVGRENELRDQETWLGPLEEKMYCGLLYLDGDAGIGKSFLLDKLRLRLQSYQYSWFTLPCDEIIHTSLNPIIYFLNKYFGAYSADCKKLS